MTQSANGWFASEREKGVRKGGSSQSRAADSNESGAKRETPLTDRIARADRRFQAAPLKTMPAFEILRRPLVPEANNVEHNQHAPRGLRASAQRLARFVRLGGLAGRAS